MLFETHMHTAEVSRCAIMPAREQMREYKKRGFRGVCVTDHFFNGNTTVPRDLPWEERVSLFCRGYELAKEEGEHLGLKVFFGWEYSYRGTDFLTYGLDKQWLLAHPEVMDMRMGACFDFMRAEGAYIIHAHPFREASYIDMIRLLPRQVDGVEILNAERTDFENARAADYAAQYGLTVSAGSDNHGYGQKRLAGLETEEDFADIHALIRAVDERRVKLFCREF